MVPLCGYSKLCLVWVLCFYSRKWNPCFISGWPRLVIQVKEVSVVQGLLWEGGVWGIPHAGSEIKHQIQPRVALGKKREVDCMLSTALT